jgi:6-phosphogluconolactonase
MKLLPPKYTLLICVVLVLLTQVQSSIGQTKAWLLIGTYTSGKSQGIYVVDFDLDKGEGRQVSVSQLSNPSFLTVSPDKRFVYAVSEDSPGQVAAYAFDKKTGQLRFLNKQSSKGTYPCHLMTDKTGQWLFAGNYGSGTLAVYRIAPDGSLDSARQVIQHKGTGPNKERQEAAHIHATMVSADNKLVMVPDLGIDKLMLYTLDPNSGMLKEAAQVSAQAGGGPRHLDFHPTQPYVYLVEELLGQVAVYRQHGTQLERIQQVAAFPAGYKGTVSSADIHVSPDGRFVYVSNRGESNTLAIFKVKDGKLSLLGHQSVMGKTPRNFCLDPSGHYLLSANQQSNEVVIFKRNKETGLLKDSGKRLSIPNPVCLKWIN